MTLIVVHVDRHSMHIYCHPTRTIKLNEAMVHIYMLCIYAKAMDLRTTSEGHPEQP